MPSLMSSNFLLLRLSRIIDMHSLFRFKHLNHNVVMQKREYYVIMMSGRFDDMLHIAGRMV
uniref:Uncharacterized protein n=1 Tax=Arundo donax TaxID=35708 RepID=A0A0A8YXP0_ARUDO